MLDRRHFLGAVAVGGGALVADPALAALPAGESAGPGGAAATPPAGADAIVAVADYMLGLRYEDIPAAVLHVTRTELFDAVGVGLGGRHEEGVRQLRELAAELGGKGEAVLWGSPLRVPAHDAARANAAMVHALEFDDTFGRGFLHPSAITFPAAFAVADMVGGISGREFLAATTAAIDIACRIAISSQPGVDGFSAGWHNTTTVGYLSSALLAARLMKLSREQTINAAGIAYHQAAGNSQSHIDGALTKRLGPGFASSAGILAARLAAKGVTGPAGVLEGKKGWWQLYHKGNYSRALLLDGLGKDFPAVEMSYKPWPSCRGSHTSADAALQLVRREGLRADQVERILIRNSPVEWPFLSNPIERKRRPQSTVEAQFSIPWVVACAIVDGKVAIGHFAPDALKRPDILALTARIDTVSDDSLVNPRGGPGQVEIEVRTRGGKVLRQHVAAAKGDPATPMSAAETDAKFADCIAHAGMSPEQGAALRQALKSIDGIADVSRVTQLTAMPG